MHHAGFFPGPAGGTCRNYKGAQRRRVNLFVRAGYSRTPTSCPPLEISGRTSFPSCLFLAQITWHVPYPEIQPCDGLEWSDQLVGRGAVMSKQGALTQKHVSAISRFTRRDATRPELSVQ